jgi:hypothetical protein
MGKLKKPTLRTETITERKLKRQLRRFIQIQTSVTHAECPYRMPEKENYP